MKHQHEDYLDKKLTKITHKALMASTKAKFDYLKLKKKWVARSPANKKIVAMATKITALKGQLKLNPKLSKIANEEKKEKKGDKCQKNTRRTLSSRKSKTGVSH